MANPIGITFLPTAESQANGPQQGGLEAPGGNLAQAFKILSLRLPRVLGASAISSPRLLNSPGASGMMGGFNPQAAIFQALLDAMNGGPSSFGGLDLGGLSGARTAGGSDTGGGSPSAPPSTPRVVPGDTGGGDEARRPYVPPPDPFTLTPPGSSLDRPRTGGGRLV